MTYDLTVNERKALCEFGVGIFASVVIIMASVLIGMFALNQLYGTIILISGSFVGYVLLLYTIRKDNKNYKKLYPKKEE